MKKYFKLFLLLFAFMCFLCGCDDVSQPKEETTYMIYYSQGQVYELGEFDISDIKIQITSPSGEYYVSLNESMLSEDEIAALQTEGIHHFDIEYKNKTYNLLITINKTIKSTYELYYPNGQVFDLNEFTWDNIKIKVTTDGIVKYVDVKTSMLDNKIVNDIKKAGEHSFDITYRGTTLNALIIVNDIEYTNYEIYYSCGQEYELGSFKLSDIKIKVTNGTEVELFDVSESMLSTEDVNALKTIGKHTVDIEYEGKNLVIEITITKKESDLYEVVSIAKALEIGEALENNEKTIGMYCVTGKIDDVTNTNFGNMTISDDTSTINIYGLFSESGTRYDKLDYKPLYRDTITVYGHINKYVFGEKTTIEIENAVLVSYEKYDDSNGQGSSFDMSYYAKANGLYGNELKLALRSIISVTKKTETYEALKKDLVKTDASLTNSSKIICFYTHKEMTGAWDGGTTWNREHVWPRSCGWFQYDGAGADLHHLRATGSQVNSSRGNTPFGTGSGYYEPIDEVKGDVARILFYMLVRYSETDTNYPVTKVAKSMKMLLDWNELDPADNLEKHRNEVAYEIQGNRNPFIDYSDYAYYIWDQSRLTPTNTIQESIIIMVDYNNLAYFDCKWYI